MRVAERSSFLTARKFFRSSSVVPMRYSPAGLPHRQSRRSVQRQAVLRRAVWVFSVTLCLGALVAGFFFQRHKPSEQPAAQQPAPQVAQEQKDEALRLIDEAVRAKYEDRTDDALSLAQRARQIDPSVRGADILAGEIAIESPDPEKREKALLAANSALDRGEDTAGSRLIFALGTWQQQDAEGAAGFTAKTRALRLIGEAADAHPFEPAVHFFWAAMLTPSGQHRDVYRKLLTALHCAQPWHSAMLVARKASLASRVAIAQFDLSVAPTSHGQGAAWKPDFEEVGAYLTARQWDIVKEEEASDLDGSAQPRPVE